MADALTRAFPTDKFCVELLLDFIRSIIPAKAGISGEGA
jgi:hypothetical protein